MHTVPYMHQVPPANQLYVSGGSAQNEFKFSMPYNPVSHPDVGMGSGPAVCHTRNAHDFATQGVPGYPIERDRLWKALRVIHREWARYTPVPTHTTKGPNKLGKALREEERGGGS